MTESEPKRRAKPLPAGIAKGTAGARLWRDTTLKYDLNIGDLAILTRACKMLDRAELIDAELEFADMMVRGSQGQDVMNPMFAEVRQHETAFTSLIAKLKLPDDVPAGAPVAGETPRSVGARHAANARWQNG